MDWLDAVGRDSNQIDLNEVAIQRDSSDNYGKRMHQNFWMNVMMIWLQRGFNLVGFVLIAQFCCAASEDFKPAVILVREASVNPDTKAWAKATSAPENRALLVNFPSKIWRGVNKDWPVYHRAYSLVDENGEIGDGGDLYKVSVHGLSEDGEKQAVKLASADLLGRFLMSNRCAPITRAITKYPVATTPNSPFPSPNPSDTLFPYLSGEGKNVQLLFTPPKVSKPQILDESLLALIDKNQLLPDDGGSTLLCYDTDVIWGSTVLMNANEKSLLEKLAKKCEDPTASKLIAQVGRPGKVYSVYVFYAGSAMPFSRLAVFEFNPYSGVFTRKKLGQ